MGVPKSRQRTPYEPVKIIPHRIINTIYMSIYSINKDFTKEVKIIMEYGSIDDFVRNMQRSLKVVNEDHFTNAEIIIEGKLSKNEKATGLFIGKDGNEYRMILKFGTFKQQISLQTFELSNYMEFAEESGTNLYWIYPPQIHIRSIEGRRFFKLKELYESLTRGTLSKIG